ncbi:MAG: DEAD/DEAH box helicase family protein [Clostridiales bacterium]|nr:DEAD/DEAH box helicase family protein [Clostridiales bacterium]
MLNEMMINDQLMKLTAEAYKNTKEIVSFNYQTYLSESWELLDYMSEKCQEPGKIIKLIAECSSGKTAFCLCQLAQRLEGKRQVILITPNKIQSEQNSFYGFTNRNGNYVETEVVVGGRGAFSFDGTHPISAVYDSAMKLFKYKDSQNHELAKTVLIIDEVHQLYSAKSYRQDCIASIEALVRVIIQQGGTVIYMTGTPRKIEGRPVDYTVYGQHVNWKGELIPGIHTGKIELLRKNSHNTKMLIMLFKLIRKYVCEGYIPFVRLNNKEDIRKLQSMLLQDGIICDTLSADQKGYYMDTDTQQVCYDSPLYASVMKRGMLPKADCYVVTSIIEVGTSIKGIVDEDGVIGTPEKFLPIFVARNPKECDFDDMRQFFARARFHTKKCQIVMNYTEDPYADSRTMPTADECITEVLSKASLTAAALKSAPVGREIATPVSGEDELVGLSANLNGLPEENLSYIRAVGWQNYYRKLYYCPQYAEEMLQKEFEIPVQAFTLSDKGVSDLVPMAETRISDELVAMLHEAVESEEFLDALMCCREIKDIPYTQVIRKMKDGVLMMHTLKSVLPGNAFPPHQAVDKAREMCEQGRNCRMPSRFVQGSVLTPKEEVVHGIFDAMKDWSMGFRVHQVLDYLRSIQGKGSDIGDAYLNKQKWQLPTDWQFALNALKETDYLNVFLDMLQAVDYTKSWKYVCQFAATHNLKQCREYVRMLNWAEWNKLIPESKAFQDAVAYSQMVSGAEYYVLRCPEKFFFERDPETGKLNWKNPLFPKGFFNKTITEEICADLASQMNRAVSQVYAGKYRKRLYKPDDIRQIIREIYHFRSSHGSTEDRNGKPKFVVTELRKSRKKVLTEQCTLESVANEIDQMIEEDGQVVPDSSNIQSMIPFIRKRLESVLDNNTIIHAVKEIIDTVASCFSVSNSVYRPGETLNILNIVLEDLNQERANAQAQAALTAKQVSPMPQMINAPVMAAQPSLMQMPITPAVNVLRKPSLVQRLGAPMMDIPIAPGMRNTYIGCPDFA